MSDEPSEPGHYWQRFSEPRATDARPHGGADGGASVRRSPPGEDLAAMRRGAGRPPGAVPQMWPFYSVRDNSGSNPSRELAAEHLALVLFGFHQQSERGALMHSNGIRFGTALRTLRTSDRYRDREESLDKRVAAAATATSFGELGWHLRGLVALLKDAGIGLDYSQLYGDLRAWQGTDGPDRVRRAWGRDYFAWGKKPAGVTAKPPTPSSIT